MSEELKGKEYIYKKIWDICCKLRRKLDFLEMRDYIFVFIFYRYISERFEQNMNKYLTSKEKRGYAYISDEEALQHKKWQIKYGLGFFILPSQLFRKVCEKTESEKEKESLIKRLNEIFKEIELSTRGTSNENNFKGLLTHINLDTEKFGDQIISRCERIYEIMREIRDFKLEFEGSKDHFGELYEYLMKMYAENSGTKGGEFYTPPRVSKLLAMIVTGNREEIRSAYDPACGSGSLLLKIVEVLGKENIEILYGQEINTSTYNLCRMNMFLNGIKYSKFDIHNGDTLEKPCRLHLSKNFDAVVSNPPYSIKWKGEDSVDLSNDYRFNSAGVLPPKSKADYAFILHCLHSLSATGKAAIICSTGALTRSGREQNIRKWLITKNYVESVILLPNNLFFGTGIRTAIMVLCKNKKHGDEIFFIDASKEFVKKTKKNELSVENIENIYNLYKNRKVISHITEIVSLKKLEDEKYDLSVTTYVKQPEVKKEININLLRSEIKATVKRINELRDEIEKIIEEIE